MKIIIGKRDFMNEVSIWMGNLVGKAAARIVDRAWVTRAAVDASDRVWQNRLRAYKNRRDNEMKELQRKVDMLMSKMGMNDGDDVLTADEDNLRRFAEDLVKDI